MKLNENYRSLSRSYLFSEVEKRVGAFREMHPNQELIRLGIGDVTLPLAAPIVAALHDAVEEMKEKQTFRGYAPEHGYPFLRAAVRSHLEGYGAVLQEDEIFISSGAKDDLAGILSLFGAGNTVLIQDPVYPVYADTNILAGNRIVWMRAEPENDFLPMPPKDGGADLIYLCSPNNPTGRAYSRAQLEQWVQYAAACDAVLIFDAAYEAFIGQHGIPHSIYEIPGAQTCAIEIASFSKTAGFTGLRCGYTVVPRGLCRCGQNLNAMWERRKAVSTNGVAYVIQRAAQAVYTPPGWKAVQDAVSYYKKNAAVIAGALQSAGIPCCGGVNSPYIWMKCPNGMTSWQFFDHLLQTAGVVGTPGSGFGSAGEGCFRLTGFGDAEKTRQAAVRLVQAAAL